MIVRLASVILVLAVSSSPLIAAAADSGVSRPAIADTVLMLPELRVDRDRAVSEARRRAPTAFVTTLEMGGSGRALESLSELLAQAAGVRILQYGGLGAFSTVSLRGAPAGQVSVFLDGAPLTSAAHGAVNLADLPVTAVERVEIYRGLGPLGLGVATPGGAINVVTRAAASPAEVRVANGSFGTWEGRASLGARRGAFSGLAHLGYQGSRGDFDFLDDNGTPLSADDDGMSPRVNNRFRAGTGLASLTWAARPSLEARASVDAFSKAQGVPGLGSTPATDTHLDFDRGLYRASVAFIGRGARPSLRVDGALDRERSRFRDARSELGLGNHDTDDRFASDAASAELSAPVAADDEASPPVALALGTSVRSEHARLFDALATSPTVQRPRRFTRGAHATVELKPAGERLLVFGGARWDRESDRDAPTAADLTRDQVTPQLGMRVRATSALELRANWTDAHRSPEFLELYGNQGSVLGNPSLEPERGRNWDAGLSWSRAWGRGWALTLESAHFESRAENLIVYVRTSQSSVRAENVTRAIVGGQEVSARLALPHGFALATSGTWTRALDDGPYPFRRGTRLPQRPAAEGDVRLDWWRGRVHTVLDAHLIGDDYLAPGNQQRAPARALVGASIAFTPGPPGLRFTLEGKNLVNDRATDVAGFPLPGRGVFIALEAAVPGPIAAPRAAGDSRP